MSLRLRIATASPQEIFGKYNSCLKKARNLLRSVGLLDETAKESLAAARKECKEAKKAAKKDRNSGRKPSEDDSDDGSEA